MFASFDHMWHLRMHATTVQRKPDQVTQTSHGKFEARTMAQGSLTLPDGKTVQAKALLRLACLLQ
jgi:hypothetical protein